ncbi:TrbG/VirB9 family P-type conjugative transfer protein [Vibrio mediterranei]|uniref:TrbG/VirB9 family P-type conjugative transfer protein n=1 Tax=Vibrio mediterranei TaxID=689 RepID=UPI001EFE2195|nr:TrbG/VirB9 family P-type conjugative transfer protein [Vibrio mediterranei]MCG9625404.1 TrbG/VirB9 family P-type conjugative transfer protein [Vibrio mediterranei]
MKTSIVLCLASMLAFPSYALTLPKSQGKDNHVVSSPYDPSDVIAIRTKVGVTTLIQLEKNETIVGDHAGLGMGDAAAWGFNVRGNNVFFKPKAKQPDTNLTIVSDLGRTYSFELITSKKETPFYIVKMEYPKPKSTSSVPILSMPCSNGKRNFGYVKWGDEALAPQYTWDDGRFTCMKFSNTTELPVVYQINTDGKEALANYHIDQDTLIIHSVADEYRLRLGDSVLGIRSNFVTFAGHNKKSSAINATRVIKDIE